MKLSILFRNWWVILIQGILMIALSIIIFNNPDAVLASLALWLGVTVIVTGLVGIIAWLTASKEHREFFSLTGSIAIVIIGILMISKLLVTIKAITLLFGALVAVVGLVLMQGSWAARAQWSLWWVIALAGVVTLIIGIKSVVDIYDGAQNISNLIGIAVLLSGIGLVCLGFLKKKIVTAISNKINKMRS